MHGIHPVLDAGWLPLAFSISYGFHGGTAACLFLAGTSGSPESGLRLDFYWQIYPYTIIAFLLIVLLIVLLNYFTIPRLGDFPTTTEFPRVSVLIPARNEEANIRACVESLLRQDYPDFEVLVMNDDSSDQTGAILQEIAQGNARLQVIEGSPLPPGWLGKHWADHQLAQKATGELILFTDADTRHATRILRQSVSALLACQADLLTAFPLQEMHTWGERLTVPILSFSVFGFFPIVIAEKLRLSRLSVTIGQFMLFRRSAFEAIGGYATVRTSPADDVMLGRKIIARGFRWKMVDGTDQVSCRMYQDFSSAVEGFTKNLFTIFEYRILLYCISWFWISVSFLLPPVALVSPALSAFLNFPASLATIAVCEALLIFTLSYYRLRTPMYLVPLYPLGVLVFVWLAFRSLIHTLLGYRSWKGRKLPPPVLRL
jgi:chlorobactene glucosyltransferase